MILSQELVPSSISEQVADDLYEHYNLLMLERLQQIRWSQLTHAYGTAEGIPARILDLQSDDPAVWVPAVSQLYDSLCHQMCSIYPATPKVFPFLIELLEDDKIRCRGKIVEFIGNSVFLANEAHCESIGELDTEEVEPQKQIDNEVREEAWKGFDTLISLVNDDDPRIRVHVPFLMSAMASQADLPVSVVAPICQRLTEQFGEETNTVVASSLVFGIARFALRLPEVVRWLESVTTNEKVCGSVAIAAAMNLLELGAASESTIGILTRALRNSEATNKAFESGQDKVEKQFHPIGKVMMQLEGEEPAVQTADAQEDLSFPWMDHWSSRWGTWRIIELLSKHRPVMTDEMVECLLPYVEQADEYTGDALVVPILKLAFGGKKLSANSTVDDLSSGQEEILLAIYHNLKLWATDAHQDFFDATGLGDARQIWADMLKVNWELTDTQIRETIDYQIQSNGLLEREQSKELRFCRIGTPRVLTFLDEFPNLETLDFADSRIDDDVLVAFAQFKLLRKIRLNNTPITDSGIRHLSALHNLAKLYIGGTGVTDACFETLSQLPSLRYVYLANTSVTDDAAEQFRTASPECTVAR